MDPLSSSSSSASPQPQRSSVATLKSRLELGHIRVGPPSPSSSAPQTVRRSSAAFDAVAASPVGTQAEAELPAENHYNNNNNNNDKPRKKAPPPPPPSAPPRKPSATTTTNNTTVITPSRLYSPVDTPVSPSSKLQERNYDRMDDHLQNTPSSPPPYAPPLPSRQNNNIINQSSNHIPTAATAAAPPQLPPRLPSGTTTTATARPTPPPRPKQETFAYSLLKKKPAAPPPKPGQGRSLPPPVIPPPVPKNSWGTQKEEPQIQGRRPSRPTIPARPETTTDTAPPPILPPPNARPSLPPRKSLPSLRPLPTTTLPVPPLPKRTPSQPLIHPVHQQEQEQQQQQQQAEEPPLPRRNILSMGFGGKQGKLPSPPRTPQPETRPPPIPIGSRPPVSTPTLNTGTKPTSNGPPPLPAARPGSSMPSGHQNINTACLKCREFSHVDAHAAKFPRHAYDDVQRLALDLTRSFGSDTDKARVIFTWLHHNVRYDVEAFFNNNVQRSTPASTLRTGLAVCEGFAGLFAAMAMYSGLEAIVIGGHGKGYGWNGPNAQSMPASPGGHAWNAVRIDNGVWQTIDPCWGAGYLCGGEYKQVFSPHHFTGTNEEFRKSHFPENPDQQFCAQPITWRDYWYMEEGPRLYSTISEPEYDYGRNTVEPGVHTLQPHTRYRFRIASPCEHRPANNNWVLMINNGQDEEVMMPDGRGGFIADMTTGAKGSKVDMRVLTVFNKQSAKGMTIDRWKNKRGANSWSYSGLCTWEV
ncbi:hypothetical protein TWF730_010863 [Orbilia blumenaviensis]|uniref:Transglutaminase-like domain-containing protein n=1 Tax=Orbilia blumenaviensis TaxID=1796055 RepID=A0AAV9ULZ8_9PEZI